MEKAKHLNNILNVEMAALSVFEKGVTEIMKSDFSSGLGYMRQCETILENCIQKGVSVDADLILATLQNIAVCSQGMGQIQDCAAYLEACIYNVKSTIKSINHMKPTSALIRKIRYLCLLYLQLSHCFSRQKKHQIAYDHAKKAANYAMLAVKSCLNFCTEAKHKKKKKLATTKSSESSKKTKDFYKRAQDLLMFLCLQMNGTKVATSSEELCMRSILGVQKQPTWINSISFEQIFEIKILLLCDLKTTHSMIAELSKDFMLDKVCMAVSSHYLLFKELTSINLAQTRSKNYLKSAISIAECFFPDSCKLLSTLKAEFNWRYKKLIKLKKGSIRSRSAKTIKNPEIIPDKPTVSSKLLNTKVMPWVPRSERANGLNDTAGNPIKKKFPGSSGPNDKTEPEPPLSEESSESSCKNSLKNFIMISNELYGDYYEEEPDKYEYMPLKIN